MKKTFFFLLLLLSSSFAWATVPAVTTTPVASHTDLSMTYLGMIFGTLGSSFHGVSGQMLGMLFYQFNIGVMSIMGVILAYSTALTTVRVASEGLANSQQRNLSLLALRIALGFGAVMPNPSTGYSPIQAALAAVVVKSVQLADLTWSYGLNYVSNGGTLWQDPNNALNSNSTGGNAKKWLLGQKNNFQDGVIPKLFANMYCTYAKAVSNATPSSSAASTDTVSTITAVAPSTPSFPSHCDPNLLGCNVNEIRFAHDCGSVNALDTVGIQTKKGYDPSAADQAYARLAVKSVIDSISPAVQQWYCASNGNKADFCGNSTIKGATTLLETSFVNAYLGYLNGIEPIIRTKAGKAKVEGTVFIEYAKKQGWATAGRFYFDLSRLSQQQAQALNPTNYINVSGVKLGEGVQGNDSDNTNDGDPVYPGYYKIGTFDLSQVQNLLSESKNTQTTASPAIEKGYGSSIESGVGGLMGLVASFFPGWGVVEVLVQTLADISHTNTDPIILLSNLGFDLLNAAGTIISSTFILAIVAGTAGIFRVCGNLALDAPWRDLSPYLKSMVMTGVFFFTGSGIMFAFYTPLYPFIVYTFAVLGWLAVVIEAMIAAPLIALGLTHPEGHDFLGQAQQSMMLIVAVFLRPVLVVMGLIISMIVSYVALKIVNYGFSGVIFSIAYGLWAAGGENNASQAHLGNVAMDIGFTVPSLMAYHNSGGFGSFLLRFFIIMPCFITIYALIVYQVINQSFRLITDIPAGVFKWIGVHAQLGGQAFNPTDTARGIESSASGAVTKTAGAGERAYGSLMQDRKDKLDAKTKKDDEKDNTKIGGSGSS